MNFIYKLSDVLIRSGDIGGSIEPTLLIYVHVECHIPPPCSFNILWWVLICINQTYKTKPLPLYTRMHARPHAGTKTRTHARTHAHTHTYICTHMRTRTHTFIHTYIINLSLYTHTHIYVCVFVCVCARAESERERERLLWLLYRLYYLQCFYLKVLHFAISYLSSF